MRNLTRQDCLAEAIGGSSNEQSKGEVGPHCISGVCEPGSHGRSSGRERYE